MTPEWMIEERRLRDAVMVPLGRQPLVVEAGKEKILITGRHPLHGVPEGKLRKAIVQALAKRQKEELAAGWRAYDTWVRH